MVCRFTGRDGAHGEGKVRAASSSWPISSGLKMYGRRQVPAARLVGLSSGRRGVSSGSA